MSEKHIIKYARDDVPRGRTDWARLRAMTEEDIEENAASDLDNPPLSDAQLEAGEVVFPEDRNKVPVYIRLDSEVVEFFKSEGPGYQTRINAVLVKHMREQSAKNSRVARRASNSAWDSVRSVRGHAIREMRATHGAILSKAPPAG